MLTTRMKQFGFGRTTAFGDRLAQLRGTTNGIAASSSEANQPTSLLQAFLEKLVPVHHLMSPVEAGRPAHPRGPIGIAVETVVTVRDDREVGVIGKHVGNAAGAGCALESQVVVAN